MLAGAAKTIYLSEETLRVAESIPHFSKWIQNRLIEYKIQQAQPEKQTHNKKEDARQTKLIEKCLDFVYQHQTESIDKSAWRWARAYGKEINMLDLTVAQFVEKVFLRYRNDSRRNSETAEDHN